MLKVNEQTVSYQEGIKVIDLVNSFKPGADLFILNGYPVSPDTVVADGDICCLVKYGDELHFTIQFGGMTLQDLVNFTRDLKNIITFFLLNGKKNGSLPIKPCIINVISVIEFNFGNVSKIDIPSIVRTYDGIADLLHLLVRSAGFNTEIPFTYLYTASRNVCIITYNGFCHPVYGNVHL